MIRQQVFPYMILHKMSTEHVLLLMLEATAIPMRNVPSFILFSLKSPRVIKCPSSWPHFLLHGTHSDMSISPMQAVNAMILPNLQECYPILGMQTRILWAQICALHCQFQVNSSMAIIFCCPSAVHR